MTLKGLEGTMNTEILSKMVFIIVTIFSYSKAPRSLSPNEAPGLPIKALAKSCLSSSCTFKIREFILL